MRTKESWNISSFFIIFRVKKIKDSDAEVAFILKGTLYKCYNMHNSSAAL